MFCAKCGKEIDDAAIICPGCGVPTQNYNAQQSPPVEGDMPVTAPAVSGVMCPNCNTPMAPTKTHKIFGGMVIAGFAIALVSLLGTGWITALLMIAGILLVIFGFKGKKSPDSLCPACGKKLSESATPEKQKMNWKKEWFKKWWIWAIVAAVLIVAVNRVSILIKDASVPTVKFTTEEAYGDRTENSQPLGIYDVQIVERSTGNYLVGKIKKNSSTPAQSYIILDAELYDSKGKPVTSRDLDTGRLYDTNKKLLSNGDIYEFELPVGKDAKQFKIIKLEEISLADRNASDIKGLLSNAEYSIKNGDFDSAQHYLDEALTIDPNNADTLAVVQKLEQAKEAAKTIPVESPSPEVSASPPADTPDSSMSPGVSATPTPENPQTEIDAIMSIIKTQLNGQFGGNYTVEYDEKSKTIVISVWSDGVTLGLASAKQGDAESIKGWNSLKDSLAGMSTSAKSFVEATGDTETNVGVFVLNDLNKDNILLVVVNGAVTYDALND